jgi:hypothetical protein
MTVWFEPQLTAAAATTTSEALTKDSFKFMGSHLRQDVDESIGLRPETALPRSVVASATRRGSEIGPTTMFRQACTEGGRAANAPRRGISSAERRAA